MSIENRLRTSLRVWHRDASVERLSELLGRAPQYFGVKGAIRGRTRDSSVTSTWHHNYWCADFARGDSLEERVDEVLDAIAVGGRDVEFKALMAQDGAGASLDAYLYLTRNVVLHLDAERLGKLAEFGIELAFDLAPGSITVGSSA